MTTQVTMDQVVRKRQRELLDESNALNVELQEIRLRAEAIDRRLAEINLEYQVFDQAGDRRTVTTVTRTDILTATVREGRKSPSDRLHFEDAIKAIFDQAGRPMKVKELVGQLERFGWQWATDQSAYRYITTSDLVESAGKHGYYQIHRPRW